MRHTTRTVTVLGLAGGLMLAAGSLVHASQATANLSASATVANNCTITTSAVAFGTYDPVVVNLSANKDGEGTLTVACTKGAAATIGLGVGSNANGSTRRMKNGTEFLTYELYQESGHTTVWTDSAPKSITATSKTAQNITVYGQVPSNQDVPSGTYSDTVTATVNF